MTASHSLQRIKMPLPDNTLPMMSGQGPFGGVEIGGMFTVVKVRKDQRPGDYKDPGWYKHPAEAPWLMNGKAQCPRRPAAHRPAVSPCRPYASRTTCK
jgi:hypothetical protein